MNEQNCGSACFKEAVCIDAGRIFDSCGDKDCIEDLQVYFTEEEQPIIDQCVSIKCKNAEILEVTTEVEPVPFNKGFYSVDLTYYFLVNLTALVSPPGKSLPVTGLAYFNKKVILFGSDGNVKTFTSVPSKDGGSSAVAGSNLPRAKISVIDPLCLSCRLESGEPEEQNISCPNSVQCCFSGGFCGVRKQKKVLVSLGVFSIVQLERSVQMMIPAYDYCIPSRDLATACDDPCELFRRIKFPTDEFFPPRLSDFDGE